MRVNLKDFVEKYLFQSVFNILRTSIPNKNNNKPQSADLLSDVSFWLWVKAGETIFVFQNSAVFLLFSEFVQAKLRLSLSTIMFIFINCQGSSCHRS